MKIFYFFIKGFFRLLKHKFFKSKDSENQYKDIDIHVYSNELYISIAKRGKWGEFFNWDIFKIQDPKNSPKNFGDTTNNHQISGLVNIYEISYGILMALLRFFKFKSNFNKNNEITFVKYFNTLYLIINNIIKKESLAKNKSDLTLADPGLSRLFLKPVSYKNISAKNKEYTYVAGPYINANKQNISKSIFCIYLDNISLYTLNKLILSKPNRFPNIFNICQQGEVINNFVSTSNWTLPAAYSIFRGIPFHKHRIYHPKEPMPRDLFHSLHGSENYFNKLQKIGWNTFHTTSNWRASGNQGFASGFTLSKDLLWHEAPNVGLAAMDNIKIGSKGNSFHFISFMDSHHPLIHFIPNTNIQESLDKFVWEFGLDFNQRPDLSDHDKIMEEIYLAQIEMIDKSIGEIINYAKSIYKNNLDIVLLSDHGTSFIKQTEGVDYCYKEKHSPCLVLPKSQLFENYKNHVWEHHDIASFIFNLANNSNHLNIDNNLTGVSQIFYPNAKYEQIFINSKNNILNYKSRYVISDQIKYKWFSSDKWKSKLYEIINNGTWEDPVEKKEISTNKVPKDIINKSKSIIDNWIE